MIKGLLFALFILSSMLLTAQSNTFPKSGNVGVFTKNPRVHLDVNGIVYTNALVLGADPVNAVGLLHLRSEKPSTDSTTIFLIENTERRLFQINNDGSVRAREIIVNNESSWPDYVFLPAYELRTLDELKSYIQLNGHLPNVPSATEVEEKGIALGEMNKILMEKVEELTLYLIQQEERIKKLEMKLSEIEKAQP